MIFSPSLNLWFCCVWTVSSRGSGIDHLIEFLIWTRSCCRYPPSLLTSHGLRHYSTIPFLLLLGPFIHSHGCDETSWGAFSMWTPFSSLLPFQLVCSFFNFDTNMSYQILFTLQGRCSGNDFRFLDIALYTGHFCLIFFRISSIVSFWVDILPLLSIKSLSYCFKVIILL